MTNAILTYNGQTINERGEMLSLTDMWRAAGASNDRRPNDWLKLKGTAEFVEHVAALGGKPASDIIQALNEAGTWNTWAHWQIGLAYAKYLSPAFHAWCNEVVRTHMTRAAQPQLPLLPEQRAESIIGSFVRIAQMCQIPMSFTLQLAGAEATRATGMPWDRLLTQSTHMDNVSAEDILLEPSDLGEKLGYGVGRQAGVMLNRALAAIGFQKQVGKAWEPTDAGRPYCQRHAWSANGKSGYNLKWSLAAVTDALTSSGVLEAA